MNKTVGKIFSKTNVIKQTIIISKILLVSLVIGIIFWGLTGFNTYDGLPVGIIAMTSTFILSLIAVYVTRRMKNLVLLIGRFLIDFMMAIDFLIFLGCIVTGVAITLFEGEPYGFFFIGGGVLYLLVSVVLTYMLYLFIDIRDSLKKLAYGEDKMTTNKQVETTKEIVIETKKCPKCNKEIKLSAKKCRYCGEWLESSSNGEESNVM